MSQYIKGGTKTAGSFHYDALFELGKGAEKNRKNCRLLPNQGGGKKKAKPLFWKSIFCSKTVKQSKLYVALGTLHPNAFWSAC